MDLLKVGEVVVLKRLKHEMPPVVLEVIEVLPLLKESPYMVQIIQCSENKVGETTDMFNLEILEKHYKVEVLPNAEVAKILYQGEL